MKSKTALKFQIVYIGSIYNATESFEDKRYFFRCTTAPSENGWSRVYELRPRFNPVAFFDWTADTSNWCQVVKSAAKCWGDFTKKLQI
jgi:hypothetical protein